MRKKGSYGQSAYRYVVKEYDTWEHNTLLCKGYYKTQREIQAQFNISRSCIYHTMHHNLERIKKYNYLVIEKLEHPILASQTTKVNLDDYESCSSSESEDDSSSESDFCYENECDVNDNTKSE